MKRVTLIGSVIVALGISTYLYAQPAPASTSSTQPNNPTTIEAAPLDTTSQTIQSQPIDALAPTTEAPQAESPAPTPAPAPASTEPSTPAPEAEPQPQPVTLVSCARRVQDTGVIGSMARYEHYDDCTYSDGSVISKLIGTSSTPNVTIGF